MWEWTEPSAFIFLVAKWLKGRNHFKVQLRFKSSVPFRPQPACHHGRRMSVCQAAWEEGITGLCLFLPPPQRADGAEAWRLRSSVESRWLAGLPSLLLVQSHCRQLAHPNRSESGVLTRPEPADPIGWAWFLCFQVCAEGCCHVCVKLHSSFPGSWAHHWSPGPYGRMLRLPPIPGFLKPGPLRRLQEC